MSLMLTDTVLERERTLREKLNRLLEKEESFECRDHKLIGCGKETGIQHIFMLKLHKGD